MTEAAPPPLTKSMKWMIGNDNDCSFDNHIGWSWIDDDGDFCDDDDDGDFVHDDDDGHDQWW